MTGRTDELVDQWLSRLAQATVDLPPGQRGELLADLREHIAVCRSELRPETEAGVRTILERLGDPAMIAAEARYGQPWISTPSSAIAAADGPPRSRRVGWLVAALLWVALLCVGICVAGVLGFGRLGGGTGTGGPEPHPGPPSEVPLPTPAPPASRTTGP
jgi:hypothetical protein